MTWVFELAMLLSFATAVIQVTIGSPIAGAGAFIGAGLFAIASAVARKK